MLQSETAECGLVCLAIVAEEFGSNIDLISLRRKYGGSTRGLTLKEIRRIATDMDMVGRAIRCEMDELSQLKTPAVLHWGMQHFVVLLKVRRGQIYFYDPAVGRVKLSLAEASRKFTGIALELSPTAAFVKRKERSPLSMRSWFRLSQGMRGSLLQIVLLSLFLQAYVIASPFYMQLAIDQAALKGDANLLGVLTIGFAFFALFNAVAALLRGIVAAKLTALLNWDMTLRLFRHMLRLPLPWFQRRRLPDILSRFDAIGAVRDLISGALVTTIIDGTLAVATIFMMVVFSPALAAVVAGGFAVYIAVRLCSLQVNMRLGSDAITARIAENGKRIETIRAIQTIKMMGGEAFRESDWANKFANTIRCDQRATIANAIFGSIQGAIDSLVKIALVYFGAKGIIKGGNHGRYVIRVSVLSVPIRTTRRGVI